MSATLGVVSTNGGNLNVRKQPSTEAVIVGSLKKGTALEVLQSNEDWYRIRVGNLSGWVSGRFVLVQDEDFLRRPLRSLAPEFEQWPEAHQTLVEQALAMLGNDVGVFDTLPQAQQRDCWGWNFRDDPTHMHYKDIVCADLVYICLKSAGARLQWHVDQPTGTQFNTQHAANYFRPNEMLKELPPEAAWRPGDIMIYWDADLSTARVRHVNLYIGPFAGMDIDGRIYPASNPADVANASIDFLGRGSKEQGTYIRGVNKARCLSNKFGRDHVLRLRHVDLDEGSRPRGIASPGVRPVSEPEPSGNDPFAMPFGQLTFDAEGMERAGPFFSRVPHVPSSQSGVTIGRGYDVGQKKKRRVLADMSEAGIPVVIAQRFADAVGLRGEAARDFITQHLADVEITPEQQKALFELTYRDIEQDAIRLCTKPDVVEKYGATDWQALHPKIRDVMVDLRYRGDYTPRTRRCIQGLIAANDVTGFTDVMLDKNYWHHTNGVPLDRFNRRCDYLNA